MKALRASSLPLAVKCRASVTQGDGVPHVSSPASKLGTAVHALAEARGDTSVLDAFDLDDDARDEALELYASLPPIPKTALREQPIEFEMSNGYKVRGTIDAVAFEGDHATVWDYKTGGGIVPAPPHNPQMWAYALGVMCDTDWSQAYIDVIMPQPAKGLLGKPHRFFPTDLDRLQAALERVAREALRSNPDYTPGPHCSMCNGRSTCPALLADIRPVAALESVDLGVVIADLTPDQLASLAVRASRLESLAKAAKAALTGQLRNLGVEAVRLDDEHEYALTQRKVEEIDPETAWPHLMAKLGTDLPDAVTITKTGIEAALKKTAPTGKLAAMLREVLGLLRDAGAMSTKTTTFYQIRKADKAKEIGQ